jgi:probable rRNA maturation factor
MTMLAAAARPGEPPQVTIDVLIEAGDWPDHEHLLALTRAAVNAAVEAAGLALTATATLSVVFTDDCHIRALNRRYREKGVPTNVLSFPAIRHPAGIGELMLGDVILARGTILREVAARALPAEDHIVHLIVHGFLHLLGYDHESDGDAAAMEGLETAILRHLGIADPYDA